MDELAHDLSVALQESSKELQQTVRRHNRKRKGKIRRNSHGTVDDISLYSVDFPNRSEASGASDLELEVTLKPDSFSLQACQQATNPFILPNKLACEGLPPVEATSDSEDQCGKISVKLSALTFPNNNSLVSGADLESDSVNELHSEKKSTDHARRRRRAKLNASPSIVSSSLLEDMTFTPENERKAKPRPHIKKKEVMETENPQCNRKRNSQRMESEPAGSYLPCLNSETGYYDVSSESSLLTSDGEETCDDHAGEADDEQSDFFHEIGGGPTYGIPICTGQSKYIDSNNTPTTSSSNSMHVQRFIHDAFPQLSAHPKLKRSKYGKYGRQIRMGHRRLKSGNKIYENSNDQPKDYMFSPPSLSFSCPEYKSPKRRRQYLPSNTTFNDYSDETILPFSDTKATFSISIADWPFSPDKRIANSIHQSNPSYRNTGNNNALTQRRRRRAPLAITALNTKKSGST